MGTKKTLAMVGFSHGTAYLKQSREYPGVRRLLKKYTVKLVRRQAQLEIAEQL